MTVQDLPDFTLSAQLQGEDPTGDLITIKTDDGGNLIIVAKGEYAETLKTLATDDQGRLLMLPYDPADIWGNALACGSAELAARLGSIKTYDRRGDVDFMDSFEYGLVRWSKDTDGTGAAVDLTVTAARSGGFGVKLTGGSTSPYQASIQRLHRYLPSGLLGGEVSFSLPGYIDEFQLALYVRDGTTMQYAVIRYDYTNTNLVVLTTDLAESVIDSDAFVYLATESFNTMKVVVDTVNKKYVRALFNDQEYDISTIAMHSIASALDPSVLISIDNFSRSGENDIAYVDDFILTQNEPANP